MSLPLIRFASKPLTRRAKGPSLLCTPSPPPAHHQLHSKVRLWALSPFPWSLDRVSDCVSLYSLCVHLSLAPRVERLDESCEIIWESLSPMKGDPIIYCLQCTQGNSDFKQVPFVVVASLCFIRNATEMLWVFMVFQNSKETSLCQNRKEGSKQQVQFCCGDRNVEYVEIETHSGLKSLSVQLIHWPLNPVFCFYLKAKCKSIQLRKMLFSMFMHQLKNMWNISSK